MLRDVNDMAWVSEASGLTLQIDVIALQKIKMAIIAAARDFFGSSLAPATSANSHVVRKAAPATVAGVPKGPGTKSSGAAKT